MELKLRTALEEDLKELQALFVDTVHEIAKTDYSQEQLKVWASGIQDKKRWLDKITNQYFLVAVKSEKIIGFASLENKDYLDLLYVHKDFQRKGIAYALYTALEKEAKRQGATFLASEVSKTAKVFFEKKGFTVVTEQTKVMGSVEISNYRMIKNF